MEPQRATRVLAVASGEGGVGKTSVVANLAFALTKLQKNVLVMDLDIEILPLGWIPYDIHVQEAVGQRKTVVEMYPDAQASRAFRRLAMAICALPPKILPSGQLQFLWQQLFR